jgi:hypothetical protein
LIVMLKGLTTWAPAESRTVTLPLNMPAALGVPVKLRRVPMVSWSDIPGGSPVGVPRIACDGVPFEIVMVPGKPALPWVHRVEVRLLIVGSELIFSV